MSEVKFTCNTCGLCFQEADFQREHMKTDWHRYNLKRRVAGLPPIPSDVFAEKMIQQRSTALGAPQDNSKRQVTKKDIKRQERLRRKEAGGTPAPVEGKSRSDSITSALSSFSLGEPTPAQYQTDDEDQEPSGDVARQLPATQEDEVEQLIQEKLANKVVIPTNVCFMDGEEFATTDENVRHLEKKYGLVIPESKYLEDLDGLVEYLNEKVGLGNCCLYCGYMGRSVEAARAHMSGKQHVKIPYETHEQKMELADFYDFSSSYGPGGQTQTDEWEDVSGSDDTDGEEDGEVHSVTEFDEYIPENDLHLDGYELKLAPGVTAGHRALQRYYKQRFTSSAPKPSQRAVKMIDIRSPGVTERQANKMIKEQWKSEKKQQFVKFKRDKHINFQKHYRDELLQ